MPIKVTGWTEKTRNRHHMYLDLGCLKEHALIHCLNSMSVMSKHSSLSLLSIRSRTSNFKRVGYQTIAAAVDVSSTDILNIEDTTL